MVMTIAAGCAAHTDRGLLRYQQQGSKGSNSTFPSSVCAVVLLQTAEMLCHPN